MITVPKKKLNSISKSNSTSMTKNTSSNRSAFAQRQFYADIYQNSTCIAAESTPHS